jgi:hypothetical protein
VKPEARKPLICEEVKPLALPMLPLQKIIASAAGARDGQATNWNKTSNPPARHDNFRCIIFIT